MLDPPCSLKCSNRCPSTCPPQILVAIFAACTTAVGLAAERFLGWPPSPWAQLFAGGLVFTTLSMLAKVGALPGCRSAVLRRVPGAL